MSGVYRPGAQIARLFPRLPYASTVNAHMVDQMRFVPFCHELKFWWPWHRPQSEGMQQLIDEMLPTIARNNPHVLFSQLRSDSDCDTKILAVYEWRRLKFTPRLDFKTKYQILTHVERFAIGSDFRENRSVNRKMPRRLQLRRVESKGHNVYHVMSKKHKSEFYDED